MPLSMTEMSTSVRPVVVRHARSTLAPLAVSAERTVCCHAAGM
jgi:hypothetical protein